MKQLVFSPIDESYKVSYLTNLLGNNENLSIYEIKSAVGSGDWKPGLCAEGQAAGLWDEYVELTLSQVKAKAVALGMNLRVYEDRQLELNTNTKLANFLTFNISGVMDAIIDHEAGTITAELPFRSVVTALTANFTTTNGATVIDSATVPVTTGTEFDLTAPVDLTVVSYDRSVIKTYTWSVTVATGDPETEADIKTFAIATGSEAVINNTAKTIAITMPLGTTVTALKPTFTISDYATIKVGSVAQVSGETENDFTNPVTYTVTAEDGVTVNQWVVTVTEALE